MEAASYWVKDRDGNVVTFDEKSDMIEWASDQIEEMVGGLDPEWADDAIVNFIAETQWSHDIEMRVLDMFSRAMCAEVERRIDGRSNFDVTMDR